MERNHAKYSIVMLLLFLFGGFSVIVYLLSAYTTLWGLEFFPFARERRAINNSFPLNRTNETGFLRTSPEAALTSPFSLIILASGIVSFLGAVSLLQLLQEKELKTVKENLTSMLLTEEEKAIIDELKKSGGKMNQNLLVRKTGLSRVKIHRALVRLETRKIVKKYPYGLTNKVVLEKSGI